MVIAIDYARFPYDRYDRCDRWEKKSSAIIWKPLSRDRSDNDRWDRTFYISAIVVAAIAAIAGEWFHMIDVFFFLSDDSDGSDHMETGL